MYYIKKTITHSNGAVQLRVLRVDLVEDYNEYIALGWLAATETEYNTFEATDHNTEWKHTEEWFQNANYGETGTIIALDNFTTFGELPDFDSDFYSWLKLDVLRLVPITCVYSSTLSKYILSAYGTPQKFEYSFAYDYHNVAPKIVLAPNSAKLEVFNALISEFNKGTLSLTNAEYSGITDERNTSGGISYSRDYSETSQAINPDYEAE